MPLKLRHRRQFNSTRTNRPEVLSLSRDERRSCRERDVRNRIIDITPEHIATHKQSLTKWTKPDPRLTASQPLRTQIGIRVRHHISHAEVAVKLVKRRRTKGAIRRRAQLNTLVETLRQPRARAKRR